MVDWTGMGLGRDPVENMKKKPKTCGSSFKQTWTHNKVCPAFPGVQHVLMPNCEAGPKSLPWIPKWIVVLVLFSLFPKGLHAWSQLLRLQGMFSCFFYGYWNVTQTKLFIECLFFGKQAHSRWKQLIIKCSFWSGKKHRKWSVEQSSWLLEDSFKLQGCDLKSVSRGALLNEEREQLSTQKLAEGLPQSSGNKNTMEASISFSHW